MPTSFSNNATSTLAAGITTLANTLSVAAGEGARFPSTANGATFPVTVQNGSSMEIMLCTARDGDLLVVTRAQEGTTAVAFPIGASVQARITAGILTAFQGAIDAKLDAGQTSAFGRSLIDDPDAASARGTLGLGSAATSASTDFAPTSHIGAAGAAHGVATTSVAGFMSAGDKAKLDGVASGATANSGTVTSVAVSGGTTGLTTSGGPITGSGTITLGGTLAVANGGTGATVAAEARVFLGAVGLTDDQTLTNKTIEAGVFTNGYTEEVVSANTGTAYTINLANGSVQNLTLTGNCTFTFPAATAGRSFLLILRQDATGSRTVTWPSATNPVRWPGGTAPTITSTASAYDLYAFTADGTRWIGRAIAQNYAA